MSHQDASFDKEQREVSNEKTFIFYLFTFIIFQGYSHLIPIKNPR